MSFLILSISHLCLPHTQSIGVIWEVLSINKFHFKVSRTACLFCIRNIKIQKEHHLWQTQSFPKFWSHILPVFYSKMNIWEEFSVSQNAWNFPMFVNHRIGWDLSNSPAPTRLRGSDSCTGQDSPCMAVPSQYPWHVWEVGLEPLLLQVLQMGIYVEEEVEPGQPGKGAEC